MFSSANQSKLYGNQLYMEQLLTRFMGELHKRLNHSSMYRIDEGIIILEDMLRWYPEAIHNAMVVCLNCDMHREYRLDHKKCKCKNKDYIHLFQLAQIASNNAMKDVVKKFENVRDRAQRNLFIRENIRVRNKKIVSKLVRDIMTILEDHGMTLWQKGQNDLLGNITIDPKKNTGEV